MNRWSLVPWSWFGNNKCITVGMGSIGEGLSNEYWSAMLFVKLRIIVTTNDKCVYKLI
ncbi:hypothetical protein [Candidatus Hodgkinia cicadicola]|uniref:hypothetical protein n=1 Tax=Candidatus Hodgkinia cicadicola TaxID=573658 RepID=UPI001788C2C4